MKTRIAIIAATLAAASAANAADIAPVYKAPPPAPVVYNWSGFYLGGNVGYGWANSDTSTSIRNDPFTVAIYNPVVIGDINRARGPLGLSDSGFTYGAQAGINIQQGNWVWGGEVDISSIRFSDTVFKTGTFSVAAGTQTYTDSFDTSWLITGRGRLGFAANNWLFYGTGGVAFTNFRYTHRFTDPVVPGLEAASLNLNRIGWTLGGGIEYGYGNWSIKAEYLWVDFGANSISAPVNLNGVISNSIFTHSADLTAQIVRVGLNYRFGGDYGKAPVVAKY